MSERMAFHVDSSACTNCKVCQIVCKDKNDLPVGVTWRRVTQYGGGGWVAKDKVLVPDGVFTYSVSTSCMNCAKPACAEVCPSGAIAKRSGGMVLIEAKKCRACRACEKACPYHALQFHAAKAVMTKCDFCQDLLMKGHNPACVDACPLRAIEFGPLDELQAKHGLVNAIEPLPPARTGPSLVLTPHRHAQRSGEGTGKVIALPARA